MSTGQDVLVLGAGFAGLSAAITLRLAGFNVQVIEQQAHAGGKASEIKAQGYRFDTGPTVFTLPHVLSEVFSAAGRPMPVVLEPLEVLAHYRFASGRTWDVYQDATRSKMQLTQTEADAYTRLLNKAKSLYEAAAPTFIYGATPRLKDLLAYGFKHGLSAHPHQTLYQLIKSHTNSPDLQQFFMRFATYFGANPYRAPAVLHNIAWVELGLGVCYPQGGIYTVVHELELLARSLGVSFLYGHKVTALQVERGVLKRVVTDNGVFDGAYVVSALDIARTFKLLGVSGAVLRKEPSLSGFVMLLGLEGLTPSLAHHSVLFSGDYRAEFRALQQGRYAPDPTLYVSVSSKSNPSDAPDGHENWFVMANAPALTNLSAREREAQDTAYAAHVLNVLAQRGLNIKSRIRYQRVLPPAYLATLAHRGSIYGHAPNSLLSTMRPANHLAGVHNLRLAGGSVHPGGGMPLALLSGKQAAIQIIQQARANTH